MIEPPTPTTTPTTILLVCDKPLDDEFLLVFSVVAAAGSEENTVEVTTTTLPLSLDEKVVTWAEVSDEEELAEVSASELVSELEASLEELELKTELLDADEDSLLDENELLVAELLELEEVELVEDVLGKTNELVLLDVDDGKNKELDELEKLSMELEVREENPVDESPKLGVWLKMLEELVESALSATSTSFS